MATKTVVTRTTTVRKSVVKPPIQPPNQPPNQPPTIPPAPPGPRLEPVTRPVLWIDGERQGALEAGLLTLALQQALNQPAELVVEIDLASAQSALEAQGVSASMVWPRLDLGRRLQLGLGPGPDVRLFSGQILSVGLSQPDGRPTVLRVVAMDALQRLQATQRQRSLPAATTAQRVASLAAEHGLATDLQWPGPVQPDQVQLGESNLAVLQRWAQADGIGFWLDDRTLRARPLEAAGPATHALIAGANLRSVDVAADVRAQSSAVLAGGWQVATGRAAAELVRPAAVAAGVDGPTALAQALGERTRLLTDLSSASAAAVRCSGQQALSATSRQFVQGRATATGPLTDPAPLLPGDRIRLEVIGPRFSGIYQVVALCRRFDLTHGLQTDLTLQRDTVDRA